MSYLHSLPIFFTVVEEGSFSSAAKKLNLTQPTVSFHIDNLERTLSCPLFTRTAKGVSPTVYGAMLYDSTNKIEAMLQETHNEIFAMVQGEAGHIILGASTIPAEYILPPLLGRFLREHPKVKITLKSDATDNILAAYAQNEFSIAVIGRKPPEPFFAQPLWHDELLLVAHPDIVRRLPTASDAALLEKTPMVIRETSSATRNTLAHALQAHGMTLQQCNIVLEVGGNEALKSAVLSQLGICFISRWAVQKELQDGSLIAINLPDLEIKRQFYALSKQPLLPTCVKNLWGFLLTNTSASR